MNFFAGRGEFPAAGLFSRDHYIMLICCALALVVMIYITSKKESKNPIRFIQIVAVVILVMEVLKMVWGMSVGRYGKWYEYLPIWFCSLFIPFSLIAGFGKGKLKQASLAFLYYGGLVGGVAYLLFPTTSLGRFPLMHFISFHSMFYHTLMIYISYFVVHNKLLRPSMKDMKGYILETTGFCVIAYVVNMFLNTNYMFLSRPSNNMVLKFFYDNTGEWYPIVITFLQNFVSFFVPLWMYMGYEKLKSIREVLCQKN